MLFVLFPINDVGTTFMQIKSSFLNTVSSDANILESGIL